MSLRNIQDIAKKNLTVFMFVYVLFLGIVDHLLKFVLNGNINLSHIHFFVNTVAIGSLFLLLILVHFITQKRSRLNRAIFDVSSVYWPIGLAPLVTYILNGSLAPLNVSEFSQILGVITFGEDINLGLSIFILIPLLLVLKRQISYGSAMFENFIESLSCFALCMASFIAVFSHLSIFPDIEALNNVDHNLHLSLLFCILILELALITFLLLYLGKREMLRSHLSNLKGFRTMHFVSMTIVGFVVLSQIDKYALDFIDPLNIPFFVLIPLTMALTWQFTAMVNDIYDIKIDRLVHPDRPLVKGEIDVRSYWNIAITLALFSLFISLFFGLLLMFLNLTFMIAALLYSIPPVRLKERLYGYVCVGYASVVAFLSGIYSSVVWNLNVEWGIIGSIRYIPLLPDILPISLIIFVVLSISPYINALPDYEGDKESGVKSIYTIYGLEQGKKIVSILIIFLFLSPLPLLHGSIDILVLTPISFFSAWLFYRYEDHRYIFMLYFVVILYILLRYTGQI